MRDQKNMILASSLFDPAKFISLVKSDGNNAGGADVGKPGGESFFDSPLSGDHEKIARIGFVFRNIKNRLDFFVGGDVDEIDNSLAFGLAGALGEFIDFESKNPALVSEDKQGVVSAGGENAADFVLFFGGHAGNAFAASSLGSVGANRHAFDVARLSHGNQTGFFRLKIFFRKTFEGSLDNFSPARVAIFFFKLG